MDLVSDYEVLLYDVQECYRILWLEWKLSGEDKKVLDAMCVLFQIDPKKVSTIIDKLEKKKL
jgi:hypothetical protein